MCNGLEWGEIEPAIRYLEKKDIKKWGFGIQIEEEYGGRGASMPAVHNGNGYESCR